MKKYGLVIALLSLCSCASITQGSSQEIYINTNPEGANCALKREGMVIGRVNPTPGAVLVQKTKHDIVISCSKKGYETSTYHNHSGSEGATWGNVILGGGIGWAIDSANGSDNHYDSPVNISLPKK